MPDDEPVTTTTLSLTRPGERAVDEKIRIEVALPVVPELRGIRFELGTSMPEPLSAFAASRLS
jgi:hypothetical protein